MNYYYHKHQKITTSPKRQQHGFSLIATLSVMVLLSVIALAMLSLSTISLRNTSQDKAQKEARANARLSLMLALAQLQDLAGQDTRVTASSTLLNEDAVFMTGVWRSWEASDRRNDGKPIPPNYDAKLIAGDADDLVADSPSDGRFLGWLSSLELDEDPSASFPSTSISSEPGDGLVAMVSEGSVAEDDERVYILPRSITENGQQSGSLAWWTSGDNSKVMLNADVGEESTTVQDQQQRVRFAGRPDAESLGFQEVDDLENDKLVPSTGTLALLADSGAETRRFHDLTAFSRGLLTNVATGGWRRDLSLFTEGYDGETSDGDPTTHSTETALPAPSSTLELPTYTIRPGEISMARKALPVNANQNGAGALLYPWASYRNGGGANQGWGHTGPIGSWTSLVDYATQYKVLTQYSAGQTLYPSLNASHSWPIWNDRGTQWSDKIRVAPIISRVQWIFSMASVATQVDGQTKYLPKLLLTPAVSIWNPYNVEMVVPQNLDLEFRWNANTIVPFRFRFSVNGQPLYEVITNSATKHLEGAPFSAISNSTGRFTLRFPEQTVILPPGRAKLFSVNGGAPTTGTTSLTLSEGYSVGSGFLYDIKDDSGVANQFETDAQGRIVLDPSDTFAIEGVSISPTLSNDTNAGTDDIGIYAAIHAGNLRVFPLRNVFGLDKLATNGASGAEVLAQIYPPLEQQSGWATTSGQIQEFDTANNLGTRPFASAVLGSRISSPLAGPDEAEFAHLGSRGMLQGNPLCYYQEVRTTQENLPGVGNFVNSNYNFSFRYVNGWNDTAFGWIPQVDPADGVGSYIVSGMAPGDGLTRCIMAELPTRPIQSLIDLQHWDAKNNNSLPPYQFNLVGNGSATPLFSPDEVSREVPGEDNQFMVNDDSYLLNHVLFDDWFVSSIAPDYGDFGVSEQRSIGEVYEEHLTGEKLLPNRFYLSAQDAASPNLNEAVGLVSGGEKDPDTDKYSYETVASKLEVAGMFNINSTSVGAWEALLRHSRDLEVPYFDENGEINTDQARSSSFSRTSIAGDQGTDSGSQNSGQGVAAEFAGHRVLTDRQIEALAEEIVDEIRKRGPFLSLSEFMNRRLSNDKDLAIASAVQKALDNLADMGDVSENPFAELQNNSVAITKAPPGNTDYEFPEAALGHSAFGMPGWIRQADVLRPLAPILSARDDTFTIRAYGDARDPSDPDKIIARAWCEATVVRSADFVDGTDDATVTPQSAEMQSELNKRYGRKFRILSFRWLNEDEI